jgi:molybdopterin-guanine dinucleotide biosynthesis protein A
MSNKYNRKQNGADYAKQNTPQIFHPLAHTKLKQCLEERWNSKRRKIRTTRKRRRSTQAVSLSE